MNFDLSNAITVTAMFRNAESFTKDISSFYTPKVQDFSFFLAGATSFNGNLPFDTSSAIDMSNMFYGATSFNGNVANFQTGKVTNMDGIFREATSFNSDISAWDLQNCLTLANAFYLADTFDGNLPWNVTSVTDLSCESCQNFHGVLGQIQFLISALSILQRLSAVTFAGASSFTGQGLSIWNTVNVQ